MCDITMAMMAMSAAQGAASIGAQRQQAEMQGAAQDAASVRELQRQQMAMRSERMQQGDEEASIAREQLKANREAEEAISTTTVAGEAVNVSGTSVGLSIQDFERSNAEYQAALALQTRMNDSARRLSLANSGQQYVSNMGQINQAIAQPDYLGTALGTAGSMMGAWQQGSLAKIDKENAMLRRDSWKGAEGLGRQNLLITQQNVANQGTRLRAAQIGTARRIESTNLFGVNRLLLGR